MRGINRFLQPVAKSYSSFSEQVQSGNTCVFVSYKGNDKDAARAIANALMAAGIDVYFDENDAMLTAANIAGRHAEVVDFIEKGVEKSSHILAVISERTKGSWWVSFEIGSGRRKKCHIAYVALQDVQNLPSYLMIAHQITSDRSLYRWIRDSLPHTVEKSVNFSESSVSIPNLPIQDRAIPFTTSP